jgi:hypothetical protein
MLITELLWGPLFASQALPLRLHALLCDLRPRFLPKGRVGQTYRAIARNGKVLLATDRSLDDLADQPAQVRLQVWHRAILPGDQAKPYGILLCMRNKSGSVITPMYRTRLIRSPAANGALALDVGGGLVLEFEKTGEAVTG